MALLQTSAVTVRFGGVTAVDAVSIAAEAGAVTGLIGPNGAGKTTMFNVISGLLPPTGGRVVLGGQDMTRLSVHRRARLGLGRTFQRLEIFWSLTARANIQVAAEFHRSRTRQHFDIGRRTDAVLEKVGLGHYADAPSDSLPTGLARMVELGRALATEPRMLLLDEPGSGLDTSESLAFGRLISDLASDGLGILLVEHDMDLIMKVCSSIHVLDFGVHLTTGTPDEVRSNPQVQRAYLGGPSPDGAPAFQSEVPL